MEPTPRTLRAYLVAVAVVGCGLLAVLVASGATSLARGTHAHFWLFAVLLLVGELMPIRGLMRARDNGVTASTTFSFALLLSSGPGPAVVVQAVASVLEDVKRGTRPLAVAFNVGQYTLTLATAGAVLALDGLPDPAAPASFEPRHVPVILAAGALFLLVNNGLAATAHALHHRARVWPHVRRSFAQDAPTATLLLGLAPIVVVTAHFSVALMPFLLLPLVAIYQSRRQVVLNEHQALHDSLTGQPNRVLFRERATQACALGRRTGATVAVMLLDLDRFKEINDTLGHHSGDEVLQHVARRLEGAVRASDTVARLGGDEFAILLPETAGPKAAREVARTLHQAIREPFAVRGLPLEVGASIGIACAPDHGHDVDELVQRADVAMYVAKERGSGVEVYRGEDDHHTPDRLALVGELREAIDRDELELFFQPKVELATGAVRGVEALVRWRHPLRGLLPPAAFVPLAEDTGLIRPLTRLVLRRAVRQARAFADAGHDLTMAVNLSASDLLDDDLPGLVGRLLREQEVDASLLELEITETTIMGEPERALATLDALDAVGVRIVVDDFGAGYSSLAYLQRLPVSELKIDSSFVLELASGRHDDLLVRSTIDLGHSLGLGVVAEGVEHEGLRERLVALGCDFAQGFLLGRPVPADELAEVLSASPN
jgi:diguanylate cyclase (GGDEF)-like protein